MRSVQVGRGEEQAGLCTTISTHLFVCARCGSYPGLYTDVSRYYSWVEDRLRTLENEVE